MFIAAAPGQSDCIIWFAGKCNEKCLITKNYKLYFSWFGNKISFIFLFFCFITIKNVFIRKSTPTRVYLLFFLNCQLRNGLALGFQIFVSIWLEFDVIFGSILLIREEIFSNKTSIFGLWYY